MDGRSSGQWPPAAARSTLQDRTGVRGPRSPVGGGRCEKMHLQKVARWRLCAVTRVRREDERYIERGQRRVRGRDADVLLGGGWVSMQFSVRFDIYFFSFFFCVYLSLYEDDKTMGERLPAK